MRSAGRDRDAGRLDVDVVARADLGERHVEHRLPVDAEHAARASAREVLEGADVGLTDAPPLLELGLIDSLTIVKLQDFANAQVGVRIPHSELAPQNLSSIRSIADLVSGLQVST